MANQTTDERAKFWKVFSATIGSGVPLLESLDIAAERADETLKSVMPAIKERIEAGQNLFGAMDEKYESFSAIELSMVKSGERGGNLDETSARLAQILSEENFPLLEAKEEVKSEEMEGSVVAQVNSILEDAISKRASDIHLDSFGEKLKLRYRIDGKLVPQDAPPTEMKNGIYSRIKTLANLNPAEHRVPQDGRIRIRHNERTIDFRVSVLPTVQGEKITLRILDKGNLTLDLSSFGFEKNAFEKLTEAIHGGWGLIIITGPTGSGKTTTLYSALAQINTDEVNACSIENPVEYQLTGVNQLQVNPNIGLTFSAAAKAILRSDPDVIMIGEIEDQETAAIATKSALTGHLVLSQLHTRDATLAIKRILEMEIDPFLVADSVKVIVGQRLLKRLCKECKREAEIPDEAFKRLGLEPEKMKDRTFYEAVGCEKCNGTGYRGRLGVYEVFKMTPELQTMIVEEKPIEDIRQKAIDDGMLTLRMDGIIKWMKGLTDLKNVLEKTPED